MARKGGHPNIAKIGAESMKPLDGLDVPIGRKVFAVKLPLDYEDKMKSLSRVERITLMRSALMNALDNYEVNDNEQN